MDIIVRGWYPNTFCHINILSSISSNLFLGTYEMLHAVYFTSDCLSNPCLHDGTCEETVDGFACHCQAYALGVQCEG